MIFLANDDDHDDDDDDDDDDCGPWLSGEKYKRGVGVNQALIQGFYTIGGFLWLISTFDGTMNNLDRFQKK